MRDRHFDPKLGGLNWQAVHDELKPKVEQAKTMADARAVMTAAVARLGQTHFTIIPSGLYEDLENPNDGPGELGLEIRLLDGRVVVTAVTDALPAARSGVKPGWLIDKIDGKPVSDILKAAVAAYSTSGMVAAHKTIAVDRRLHGHVGSAIAIDFLDGKRQARPSRAHRQGTRRSARDVRQPPHVLRPVHVPADRKLGRVRVAERVLRRDQRHEAIR